MLKHVSVGVLVLLGAGMLSSAATAQTANQICQRMISEGRGDGLSVQDCLCRHRVAEAVLDRDIRDLLFDAWYTGADNMAALAQLPNARRRVEQQFRTIDRTLRANCN